MQTDKAIAEYRRVAEEHPGTELEATARLLWADELRANFRSLPETERPAVIQQILTQLDTVAQRFPGSRYAFVARWMRTGAIRDPAARRASLDALVTEIGGLTFREMLDPAGHRPFSEYLVPAEYRADLAELYDRESRRLDSAQQNIVQLFLRESFPVSANRTDPLGHFSSPLLPAEVPYDATSYPGGPVEPDQVAPRVLSNAPADGSTVTSQPTISASLTDGDHWAQQILTDELRVKLDGADVTPWVFWKTDIDATGTRPEFEILSFTLRPPPLAPGRHLVELTASDLAHNTRTTNWSFVVPAAPTFVDPTVRIRSPQPNQVKGPRPRIRVEITTGQGQPRADLNALILTLDGQDMRPYLQVRSKLKKKPKPGAPLERIRLEARPPRPLARGNHTVSLVVPTVGYPGTGPGVARLSWSFMVVRTREDDEDECNDWGEEWERDWRNDRDEALLLRSLAVTLPAWEPAAAVENWARGWMAREFAQAFWRPQPGRHHMQIWLGLGYGSSAQ